MLNIVLCQSPTPFSPSNVGFHLHAFLIPQYFHWALCPSPWPQTLSISPVSPLTSNTLSWPLTSNTEHLPSISPDLKHSLLTPDLKHSLLPPDLKHSLQTHHGKVGAMSHVDVLKITPQPSHTQVITYSYSLHLGVNHLISWPGDTLKITRQTRCALSQVSLTYYCIDFYFTFRAMSPAGPLIRRTTPKRS